MAPNAAIRATEPKIEAEATEEEDRIQRQNELEDLEDDNEDDGEEAPSHLPFAPSSDFCDTSTTIDPSYIISLIRQLLLSMQDAEKQTRTDNCIVKKETPHTGALVDLGSHTNLTNGSPSSHTDNGAPCEYGEQESNGISDDRQIDVPKASDPWEDCGCVLWDLSANKTHAEFMVKNHVLDVLVANLQISESCRSNEICLGIIGNIACHDFLSSAIVSTDGLVKAVVDQLFVDDSTCLLEAFRLLSAVLQSSCFSSWVEALVPDQVLQRMLWVTENTLNSALLEKSIDFLLTVINNHGVSNVLVHPLINLGLPNLLTSLLEGEINKLRDEKKVERSSVLDHVLSFVEAISSNDNYSQMIFSNEDLASLVCGVVKLPDKIEVASSCVSAVVIIANILVDDQNLSLKLSHDFSFLHGLFDILPFLSDDPQARSAFWCITVRLLNQVEASLGQFASFLVDKSPLIEDDIERHSLEDFGGSCDGQQSHAITTSLQRIAFILEKSISEDSDGLGGGDDGNGRNDRLHRLLHCCHKHLGLK